MGQSFNEKCSISAKPNLPSSDSCNGRKFLKCIIRKTSSILFYKTEQYWAVLGLVLTHDLLSWLLGYLQKRLSHRVFHFANSGIQHASNECLQMQMQCVFLHLLTFFSFFLTQCKNASCANINFKNMRHLRQKNRALSYYPIISFWLDWYVWTSHLFILM